MKQSCSCVTCCGPMFDEFQPEIGVFLRVCLWCGVVEEYARWGDEYCSL